MRALAITALLGTVLLTGCAAPTTVGAVHHLYRDAAGREVLEANPYGSAVPITNGRDGGEYWQRVTPVRVTNNPHDEEFWQFEARLKIRSVSGIPYGREPRDYNVIGSRDRCEDERVHWIARSIPTESCRGPFFFRRDPVAGATPGSVPAPVEHPPVAHGGVVVPGTPGIYGGNDELGLSQLFLGSPYVHLGVAGGPADFADQFDGASPEEFGRQNEDLLGRR